MPTEPKPPFPYEKFLEAFAAGLVWLIENYGPKPPAGAATSVRFEVGEQRKTPVEQRGQPLGTPQQKQGD